MTDATEELKFLLHFILIKFKGPHVARGYYNGQHKFRNNR